MWQMLSVTNDGLVGYRRTGGPAGDTLVPDLAAALPAPTAGGRTYTFHLRSGIRFSNGTPGRPQDFRRAIERGFAINAGPTAYFTGIIGAGQCVRAPARCDLARGIVTNDNADTVTFHLTAPDPEFLYKLAFPLADAVPAGTPDREVGPAQLPATGPYMTQSFVPLHRWVLVRNPRFREWSDQAQPGGYPSRIMLRLDIPPGACGQRGRAEPRQRAPLTSPRQDPRTGDALSKPAAQRPGGRHDRACAQHPRLAVQCSRRAAGPQLRHRPATLIQLIGGPLMAHTTCQILPRPARLPAVLPLYDRPQPQWRLDGTQPRQGRAARPRLRHPRRQGNRHRCLRHRDPVPGARPLPGVGPRPARIPGIAASGHRVERIR